MYFVSYGKSMSKKSAVITLRLSRRDLEKVEAVRTLEDADRSTLIKEFIEDGLRRRVTRLYHGGRVTAAKAAEVLAIPLREFLEMLEREGVPINWDSEVFREYLREKYGEPSVAKSGV